MARAKGICIVNSNFLVEWQETGKIPSCAKFPVCLPSDYGAEPTVLPPLQPDMLRHATFDTTGDLEELSFPLPPAPPRRRGGGDGRSLRAGGRGEAHAVNIELPRPALDLCHRPDD